MDGSIDGNNTVLWGSPGHLLLLTEAIKIDTPVDFTMASLHRLTPAASAFLPQCLLCDCPSVIPPLLFSLVVWKSRPDHDAVHWFLGCVQISPLPPPDLLNC